MATKKSPGMLVFHVLRAVFRALPIDDATRDRWRTRFVQRHGHRVPVPRGKTTAGRETAASGYPLDHAAHRAMSFRERSQVPLPTNLPAEMVAFYLPQFHPIPENDAWWGTGFTEWRNVGRALPQFAGQVQPRLPGELGYYDLRLPETMRKQMELAREYGISAFCMYFYWFAGKTLLERPLRQWLQDASLDLPICLCWANENWSRRWDGLDGETLIAQEHSVEDDLAFIAYVSVYMKDPRYLRVEGKPMLLVYRAGLLSDPLATTSRWRTWCRENGVGEIHLACVQSFDALAPSDRGFDAAVAFPPNDTRLNPVTADFQLINPAYQGQIYDWRELPAKSLTSPDPAYRQYPCINPGWDNEARRSGRGLSFVRATPRAFSRWARGAVELTRRRSPSAPLVFVNAWNEWAEGAILEPDMRFGYAWLEGVRRALLPEPSAPSRPCVVIHVWYPDLLEEIVTALRRTGLTFRTVLTVPVEREEAVRTEVARLAFDAEVVLVPNKGRDILPFLQVATRLLDEGEDIVLKLHTKRSPHRDNGEVWRTDLLERLVSPARSALIVRALQADPLLGMVTPEGHVRALHHFWGSNRPAVEYLAALTGVPLPGDDAAPFVAGSMFWCRLSALSPIIDAPLVAEEFETEAGQTDGTLAHAVERLLLLTALASGYRYSTAARLAGDPEPEGEYAYAKRQ